MSQNLAQLQKQALTFQKAYQSGQITKAQYEQAMQKQAQLITQAQLNVIAPFSSTNQQKNVKTAGGPTNVNLPPPQQMVSTPSPTQPLAARQTIPAATPASSSTIQKAGGPINTATPAVVQQASNPMPSNYWAKVGYAQQQTKQQAPTNPIAAAQFALNVGTATQILAGKQVSQPSYQNLVTQSPKLIESVRTAQQNKAVEQAKLIGNMPSTEDEALRRGVSQYITPSEKQRIFNETKQYYSEIEAIKKEEQMFAKQANMPNFAERKEQIKQQFELEASKSFYSGLGYPEYAGYSPFEVPEGYTIASIKETPMAGPLLPGQKRPGSLTVTFKESPKTSAPSLSEGVLKAGEQMPKGGLLGALGLGKNPQTGPLKPFGSNPLNPAKNPLAAPAGVIAAGENLVYGGVKMLPSALEYGFELFKVPVGFVEKTIGGAKVQGVTKKIIPTSVGLVTEKFVPTPPPTLISGAVGKTFGSNELEKGMSYGPEYMFGSLAGDILISAGFSTAFNRLQGSKVTKLVGGTELEKTTGTGTKLTQQKTTSLAFKNEWVSAAEAEKISEFQRYLNPEKVIFAGSKLQAENYVDETFRLLGGQTESFRSATPYVEAAQKAFTKGSPGIAAVKGSEFADEGTTFISKSIGVGGKGKAYVYTTRTVTSPEKIFPMGESISKKVFTSALIEGTIDPQIYIKLTKNVPAQISQKWFPQMGGVAVSTIQQQNLVPKIVTQVVSVSKSPSASIGAGLTGITKVPSLIPTNNITKQITVTPSSTKQKVQTPIASINQPQSKQPLFNSAFKTVVGQSTKQPTVPQIVNLTPKPPNLSTQLTPSVIQQQPQRMAEPLTPSIAVQTPKAPTLAQPKMPSSSLLPPLPKIKIPQVNPTKPRSISIQYPQQKAGLVQFPKIDVPQDQPAILRVTPKMYPVPVTLPKLPVPTKPRRPTTPYINMPRAGGGGDLFGSGGKRARFFRKVHPIKTTEQMLKTFGLNAPTGKRAKSSGKKSSGKSKSKNKSKRRSPKRLF